MSESVQSPFGSIIVEGIEGAVQVPVYGLEQIAFQKQAGWKMIKTLSVSTANIMQFDGEQLPEIPLDWVLTAGVTADVPDRKKLHQCMITIHAAATFTEVKPGTNTVLPPPQVRLVIPSYLNARGVMTRVSTAASGPWESATTSGENGPQQALYPTSCRFTCTFVPAGNYDPDKGIVSADLDRISKFSAKSLVKNYYSNMP